MTQPPSFTFPDSATPGNLSQAVEGSLTSERHATSVAQGRPGEISDRYTSRLTGDRTGPVAAGADVVGPRGLARRVTGEGVVAMRDRINVMDGQKHRLMVQVARQSDPSDPSGASVRAGIAWLNADKEYLGAVVVYSTTLTVADGLQTVDTTFSAPGVVADHEAPPGAVYAVPYVRCYDIDGETLVEQIEVEIAGIEGPASTVPGPRGHRGFPGIGEKGDKGDKGDPGNFLGLSLIGSSDDIADRPASANAGDAWGLLEGGTIRIYIWSGTEWGDAGPLTTPEDLPIANTLFVASDGNDADSGTSEQAAVATIEQAVSIATTRGTPTLIKIGPGTYQSAGHIDLPDNCAVQAAHRTVTITPTSGNAQKNVFRLGSGCFVEGPTFAGWEIDDLDNPTEGFAIAFRPGAVINRVPYAHKIAAYRGLAPEMVAAPMDRANGNPEIGNGMGVCIADGAVISPFSAFPNIMTWGATPTNPNGIGYVARNRALINAVNAVSLWCHKHHVALGGGQVVLSSCSTQFGDYSLWSEGFADILRLPTVAAYTADGTVAPLIDAEADTIIDDMWDALVAGSYTTGWTADDEAFTRRDAAIFLKAVGYALTEGKQRAMEEFTRGMFAPEQDATDPAICRLAPVFDIAKEAAFIFAFEAMRDDINALTGVNAAAQTAVTNLVALLTDAIETPVTRRSRSEISAIGHTWTFPLSGVTRSGVPPEFGGSGATQRIQRSVARRKGGRVVYSGQDSRGNVVFASGALEIDERTGLLKGRSFDAAVEIKAVEAAIASTGV